MKKQKSGTAIGAKLFTSLCSHFYGCSRNRIPYESVFTTFFMAPLYWHYIFIWAYGEKKLIKFLKGLNNFYPNLSFTYDTSKSNVNFLNLNVSLRDGAIYTDLYIKPIQGHQYPHYHSSHPYHIQVSTPYSKGSRVTRIYSSEKDVRVHICGIKEWFLARGYPEKVVKNQIDEFVFGKNPPVKKSLNNGTSFVATYHPKVKKLGELIKDLLPFLCW